VLPLDHFEGDAEAAEDGQERHGKIVEQWAVVSGQWSEKPLFIFDKDSMVGHYGGVHCGSSLLQGIRCVTWRESMSEFMRRIWSEDAGQDIAEYAVMLAVILVLVVGTIRLIGSNANNAFSNVASSIQ
jgi:Flp pilus assembly pilin Flp